MSLVNLIKYQAKYMHEMAIFMNASVVIIWEQMQQNDLSFHDLRIFFVRFKSQASILSIIHYFLMASSLLSINFVPFYFLFFLQTPGQISNKAQSLVEAYKLIKIQV